MQIVLRGYGGPRFAVEIQEVREGSNRPVNIYLCLIFIAEGRRDGLTSTDIHFAIGYRKANLTKFTSQASISGFKFGATISSFPPQALHYGKSSNAPVTENCMKSFGRGCEPAIAMRYSPGETNRLPA